MDNREQNLQAAEQKAAAEQKTETAQKAVTEQKTESAQTAQNAAQANKPEPAQSAPQANQPEAAKPVQSAAQASQPANVQKPETAQPVPDADDSDEDLVTIDLNEAEPEHALQNTAKAESRHEHPAGSQEANSRPVKRREKKPVDPYKQKRRKKRIIWLVVLGVLVTLILLFYFRVIRPAKEMAESMLNQMNETTDTIEERDIVKGISTTGLFAANDVRTVTSTAKDPTIDAVLADVGDHVNKGDTLVIFSTDAINKTIEQLQEDLAESRRLQAVESRASDRSYMYTYTDQANQLLNQSEKVEAALKALYEACDWYGDAKRRLQEAKDEGADALTISSLENEVNNAYQNEQTAQSNYNAAVTAQGQLVGSTGNTLTQADENHEIEAIKAGDQARNYARQIEDAQEKLENYVLTAPISGIVTKVDVEEGNGFAGGTVMTIQNTDSMKIIGRVDEYDIPDVELGQQVVIRTDATRDEEMHGYVSFIEPSSTTTSSGELRPGEDPLLTKATDAIYDVTVTVQDVDPRIKIGMFAKLNIVVDKASKVLTVPYDAIQTNADGQYYITVVEEDGAPAGAPTDKSMPVLQINGENAAQDQRSGEAQGTQMPGQGGIPQQNRRDIIVEIGMEGDYYTQVISDEIRQGMTVIIPDDGKFDLSDMQMMFGF